MEKPGEPGREDPGRLCCSQAGDGEGAPRSRREAALPVVPAAAQEPPPPPPPSPNSIPTPNPRTRNVFHVFNVFY